MTKGIIEFRGEKCIFELDKTNFLLEIEIITSRGFDEKYIRSFNNLTYPDNLFEGLLVGQPFDDKKIIYFNMHNMYQINHNKFQGIIKSYLLSKENAYDNTNLEYDALEIQADELNYFYHASQGYSFNEKLNKIFINNSNINESFSFDFKNSNIEAELGIKKDLHFKSVTPVSLSTALNLTFERKSEFSFAEDLSLLTRNFLKIVTFRRNVNFIKLVLKRRTTPNKSNRKLVGEFFVNIRDNFTKETDKKAQQQIIDYQLIKDHLSSLFVNLANNTIYMSHLPESIQDSRLITPARYIMVTAGFEWEFSRSLEDSLTHITKKKYDEEIKDISDFFEKRIEETSGKKMRFYENTKKRALGGIGQAYTLEKRLTFAFKEFDDVLIAFIKNIYSYNGVEFDSNYSELAKRIARRRNAIGHGNISEEAHELHGIDMLILEWLYYAMLLRSIGMNDEKIKKSINKLFGRGMAF